ncbi:hypothetical protein I5535_08185 [Rhodobacteraceae bacterium F11138]|nr:hypothetical protein [Rhodobacteraceae bacterium F11138]
MQKYSKQGKTMQNSSLKTSSQAFDNKDKALISKASRLSIAPMMDWTG